MRSIESFCLRGSLILGHSHHSRFKNLSYRFSVAVIVPRKTQSRSRIKSSSSTTLTVELPDSHCDSSGNRHNCPPTLSTVVPSYRNLLISIAHLLACSGLVFPYLPYSLVCTVSLHLPHTCPPCADPPFRGSECCLPVCFRNYVISIFLYFYFRHGLTLRFT